MKIKSLQDQTVWSKSSAFWTALRAANTNLKVLIRSLSSTERAQATFSCFFKVLHRSLSMTLVRSSNSNSSKILLHFPSPYFFTPDFKFVSSSQVHFWRFKTALLELQTVHHGAIRLVYMGLLGLFMFKLLCFYFIKIISMDAM